MLGRKSKICVLISGGGTNLQALLDAEAREAVQVMEFNGELFVSMNGVPLLAVCDLNETLPEVVSHARQNYKDWKEEKLWEQSGTTQGFIPC